MIGRVGTIFGAHGINISSAAVGHVPDGGEAGEQQPAPVPRETEAGQRLAAMVVTTDAAVPDEVVGGDRRLGGLRQRLVGRPRLSRAGSVRSRVGSMRAVVITKHGGPGVLQVQERPDPPLGAGEVRIEVAAAGINFADVMARMGLYPDAPKTAVRRRLRGRRHDPRAGGGRRPDRPLSAGQRVLAGTQFGGYASQVVGRRGTTWWRCRTAHASSRAPRSPSTTAPPGRA